jgi:hypothetical protein
VIEQVGNAVKFVAFFTSARQGKSGLTVTIDVYNPAGTLVVTAGSATEVGGGLYSYTLASGSVTTEGEYLAVFKTTDTTVDAQHIPALWVVGRAGVEHLDADIADVPAAVLIYAASNVDGTADEHSLYTVIQSVLNWSTSASVGNLVIYETDGTTVHATIPLDSVASFEAIVSAGA